MRRNRSSVGRALAKVRVAGSNPVSSFSFIFFERRHKIMRIVEQEQKAKSQNYTATSAKCYHHMEEGHGVPNSAKEIFHQKPYYLKYPVGGGKK